MSTRRHPIATGTRRLISLVTAVSLASALAPVGAAAAAPETAWLAANALEDPIEPGVGLVDPATGLWYLRNAQGQVASFYYGNPGDVPFMGDWDCDGIDTPGLFRQSDAFAYLRNSNDTGIAHVRFFFGNPSDIPLAGDFDGDGCDSLSIYRPSEQRFYIINELGQNEGGLGAAEFSFLFGNPGDKPVVGDWDGDGIDEVGLHRESTGFFYYRNTLDTGIADAQFFFGDPNDRFVAGDWGLVDGTDTPAIFRPSDTTFYFRHSNTQGIADDVMPMGRQPWLPVAGDFGTLTPRVRVVIDGAPPGLVDAVAALYSWGPAAPDIATGFRSLLADQPLPATPATLLGGHASSLVNGVELAVVTLGGDVVLAANRGPRWKVVGAKLVSRGKAAWYGAGPRHVLVIGSDARPGGVVPTQNADSLHILTADASSGRGVITGIPRDTFVTAPYGIDKAAITMRQIEPSKAWGPDTTLSVLRNETGLPIEGYLVTGFAGFTDLVETWGGIVARLFYAIPPPPTEIPAGSQFLDGASALRVARERMTYPSGDMDRQLTGGDLILGALGKAQSLGIRQVPAMLSLLATHVSTSLSPEQLLTLGATAYEVNAGLVPNILVEGRGTLRVLRGDTVAGPELTADNRAAFADLADAQLDPGRCVVSTNAVPTFGQTPPACWLRP